MKPEKKTPKKPKKKLVTKFRVCIGAQHRDFDSQDKAREWTKELLQAPIYFVNMTEVKVEE